MFEEFRRTVEKYSHKAAIICKEEMITFAQLYERVCEEELPEGHGIIKIVNDREIHTIVKMLAACRAKRPYIVVDSMDETLPEFENNKSTIYIVGTSGTTGEKKYIYRNAKELIEFIKEYGEVTRITADDMMLNQLEFTFDASSKDIYSMVILGATLLIGEREHMTFPAAFIGMMNRYQVTAFQTTPFFMKMYAIMRGFGREVPRSLNKVMFVGDNIQAEHLNYWIEKLPTTCFYNLYGRSENVGTLMYDCFMESNIDTKTATLRKVFSGGSFSINEDGVLVITTKSGENIVTGDMAMKLEDGRVVICGRSDNIRKIRGYRISLDEIEKAIMKYPIIEDVACEIKDDNLYVLYKAKKDIRFIKEFVGTQLPDYCNTKHIKRVEKIEYNENGKKVRRNVLTTFLHP